MEAATQTRVLLTGAAGRIGSAFYAGAAERYRFRLADRERGGLPSRAGHEALALDVHVVSDLRTPLDAVVTACVRWQGGEHTWRWQGSVPSDAVVRVGTLSVVVPDAAGDLTVDLDLVAAEVVASSSDATVIAGPG